MCWQTTGGKGSSGESKTGPVAGWVKDDCESGDGDDKEENDAVAEAGEGEADFFDSNLSFNSCSSSTDFRFMARTIEATGILLRTRVKKCIGISW